VDLLGRHDPKVAIWKLYADIADALGIHIHETIPTAAPRKNRQVQTDASEDSSSLSATRPHGEALVTREQFRGSYVESVGELEQIAEAHVALTALDPADVRAVHPATVCQTLLRDPGGEPQLSDRLSERCVFRRSGPHWHASLPVHSL
jgi:hypothetical protein